jgi:hypothetical protein
MDWKAVRAADVAGLNAFFIKWAGLLPGPRPDIADVSTGWAQDTNRLQKRTALSGSPEWLSRTKSIPVARPEAERGW